MPEQGIQYELSHRDGASQNGRRREALAPEYATVDERSFKDLLAFVRDYAKELRYFNSDNQALSTWSAFIDEKVALDDIVRFCHDPESVSIEVANYCRRPHFVLLLSVLKLILASQQGLNDFTRRHLDFYFQKFLGIQSRPATPDNVHVYFDLAKNKTPVHLPKGTALHAGKDPSGKQRHYALTTDTTVNHGSVAECRSVFIDSELIGIEQTHRRATDNSVASDYALIDMLKIALGEPSPGDDLPLYPRSGTEESKAVLDVDKLHELKAVLDFISVESGLAMQLSEFKEIMTLKARRDEASLDGIVGGEWQRVNAILEQAYKNRLQDQNATFTPANPSDFEANLKAALDLSGDLDFSGAPGDDLTKIYRELLKEGQETEQGVIYLARKFVEESLYLTPFIGDDAPETSLSFEALMQVRVKMNADWQRINEILLEAEQRRFPDKEESNITPIHSPDFDNNIATTIAPDFTSLGDITSLSLLWEAVQVMESYFFLAAADIAFLFNTFVGEQDHANNVIFSESELAAFRAAYNTLTLAHRNLVLEKKHQAFLSLSSTTQPLLMMVRFLGLDISATEQANLIPRGIKRGDIANTLVDLAPFLPNEDRAFLLELANESVSPPEINWSRVARAFAIAQRNIASENLTPVREQWYNLYAAEDAKLVASTQAILSADSTPSWPAFGAAPEQESAEQSPKELGWAFSSPLLFLEQGQREIQLTLYFTEDSFDDHAIGELLAHNLGESPVLPLRCEVSGPDTWVEPSDLQIQILDDADVSPGSEESSAKEKALRLTLLFSADAPALVASSDALGIDKPNPVLRVMLRQQWQKAGSYSEQGRYISHYPVFRDLQLTRMHCQVSVNELTNLSIQNDVQELRATAPFEPFGIQPQSGSRFFVGHPELVRKPLEELCFNIDWMGLDNDFDFTEHYKHYSDAATDFSYDKFKVDIALHEKSSGAQPIKASNRQLFKSGNHSQRSLDITGIDFYQIPSELVLKNEVKQWDRYFSWELGAVDFQHNNYPVVSQRKAVELALQQGKNETSSGETVDAREYVVNPPYTPKIKKLSVNYRSALTLNAVSLTNPSMSTQDTELLHLHPFGYAPAGFYSTSASKEASYFLPRYIDRGQFYVGLQNLHLPQNISILFQLAEGTANPDLEPQRIRWSYLSENTWVPMQDGGIIKDETMGLIQSGIIEFSLKPVGESTLMPAGQYWLKASIARNTRSVCTVVALHTQAASAQFKDQGNAAEHYASPLPANTITRFVTPRPGIKKISQPYTSFGGKEAEREQGYRTRVSERLRHKQRCVNPWDYEHLVLEQFPQVFKARCVPARTKRDSDQPGKLALIVIPDIRNRIPFAPHAPKVSRAILTDIQNLVERHKPLSASIEVKNPFYIQVEVRLSVRFNDGEDESFAKHQLNQELKRFLSPWAYDEGADIIIGGRVYANNIIHFVEQRPYIDYVTNIKLFYKREGDRSFTYKVPPPIDSEEGYFIDSVNDIEGAPQDGVLVGADEHGIDIIADTGYQEELFTGIGYMKIEYDFQVG